MSCLGGLGGAEALAAYAAFALAALVGPALALLRLLGLRPDPAAVLPLGLALCAAAYWASLVLALPWLFPVLVVGLDLVLLVPRGSWRRAPGPPLGAALPPVLGLAALFAVTQFPFNRCAADGSFLLDPLERVDSAFHVAVTWELTGTYPPQVPGLAGVPLAYHFGPHLVRAAAFRWAGIHPYDALARFDLMLWTVALILALRQAAGLLGLGRRWVNLAPWTLLATDGSFLLGLVASEDWWTELLGSNLLLSLFFTNAAVPALAMALAALGALARAEGGEGHAWRIVAAGLGLALPFFKIFLAAQFVGALLVALVLARRRAWGWVLLPGLITGLALALGPGGRSVGIFIEPFGVVHETRARLGWPAVAGWELVLWALVWILLSLGLRLVGLPGAVRALFGRGPAVAALAAMALSGWVLRLLLRLTAHEEPHGHMNEAVYFTVHSGALLWLFVLPVLERRLRRRPLLLALATATLCLPTSAEFVWRRLRTPADVIPAAVPRAMLRLAERTRPGEVVLQPSFSRYPPPPLVLIGRRVPYAEYFHFLEQFADTERLGRRLRTVRRFFKTHDVAEARRLAARSGARYVCAYGRRPSPELSTLLEVVYEDDGVVLYRFREDVGDGP